MHIWQKTSSSSFSLVKEVISVSGKNWDERLKQETIPDGKTGRGLAMLLPTTATDRTRQAPT
ncbi:hypothetical protein FRB91_002877 [Serendipita sp. 411]|nr:hypothetical protein FRC19_000528 [Serendipita sp. 401]KAG8818747.1 hypothetical protein FRC18_012356 [Serendipita sp. 400]KAG8844088.1 hypothetical protein FRB91_002877 [Serendipita sp. 411]